MKVLTSAVLACALLQLSCASRRPSLIRLAGDAWFLDALTRSGSIPDFERRSGIRVEVVHRHDNAIMSDFDRGPTAANPAYDVVVMRHRFLGKLIQKRQIQPIDSFLAESSLHDASFKPEEQLFSRWWHGLSSYQGGTYGYPYTCLTTYLCYRRDLLNDPANQRAFRARYHRDLQVPQSWDEYNQVAEFFTRPAEHFYGTYIQGKQHIALWYEWLNFAYSFGGNILDSSEGSEYGDIVVNSPQNVAATNEYLKLIAYSPPDTLTYSWDGAQSSLQQGRVFMGLLWDDQAPFLEAPAVSKVAGRIGYALIPSDSGVAFSQMEGLTWLIPAEAQHPREAYRLMEWAMSANVQIAQALEGSASPRKSTYDDPRVKAIPYSAAFLASVPAGRPKPTIPESAQITDAMVRGLFGIVSGNAKPQQGLDAMALEIGKILGNKAKLRYPVSAARR